MSNQYSKEEDYMYIEYDYVLGWFNILKNFATGNFKEAITSASRLFRVFGLEDPYKYFVESQYLLDAFRKKSPIIKRIELIDTVFNSKIPKGVDSDWRLVDLYKSALILELRSFKILFDGLLELKEKIEEAYGEDIGRLAPPGFIEDLISHQIGFSSSVGGYPAELYDACLLTSLALITGYRDEIPPLVNMALKIHYYMSIVTQSKYNIPEYTMKYRRLKKKFDYLFKTTFQEIRPYIEKIKEIEESTIKYQIGSLWLVKISREQDMLPTTLFKIPNSSWMSGTIPHKGTIILNPIDFTLFPTGNRALINAVYGITGSGKTSFITSLALARLDRDSFGFRAEIDIDMRMQTQLMALPLQKEHPAYKWLVEHERLKPRGLIVKRENMSKEDIDKELRDPDIIDLVVVMDDKQLDDIWPPLKFSRVVYVERPDAFKLDFNLLVRPGKVISMRFVDDHTTRLAYRSLVRSFMDWRRRNKKIKAFFQIEEALLGAAAMPSMIYGGSSVRSAETVAVLSRGARGLGLAMDISTQRASWLVAGARSQVSNIFTGYIGEKKDLDVVLQRLPYGADKTIIENILQHPEISEDNNYKWFLWMDFQRGLVHMVRPVFPPCAAEITTMDIEEQFKKYNLTFESWDQVPQFTDKNLQGNRDNPLPIYEQYLTEKEKEKLRKKREKLVKTEEEYGDEEWYKDVEQGFKEYY